MHRTEWQNTGERTQQQRDDRSHANDHRFLGVNLFLQRKTQHHRQQQPGEEVSYPWLHLCDGVTCSSEHHEIHLDFSYNISSGVARNSTASGYAIPCIANCSSSLVYMTSRSISLSSTRPR